MTFRLICCLPLAVSLLACTKDSGNPQLPPLPVPAANSGGGGSSVRGGGDEVALEFERAFSSAMQYIQTGASQVHLDPATIKALTDKMNEAEIIVVDKPLTVEKDGAIQFSVAVNHPDPKGRGCIEINRKRWNSIRRPAIREALALHEVASLLNLERTASYPISGLYIKDFNLSQSEFEPVKGYCSAPRSEQSSCEDQLEDMGYNTFKINSTIGIRNTVTNATSAQLVPRDGQTVSFHDENKGYSVSVSGKNPYLKMALTFTVTTDKPTDDPRRIESVRESTSFEWYGDKFGKADYIDTHIFYNRPTDGDVDGQIFGPADVLLGTVILKRLPGDYSQSTEIHTNLNVPYGPNLIAHSLIAVTDTWTIQDFGDLGRYGVPRDLETALRIAVGKFAVQHAGVNKIRAMLNKCTQGCESLRQLYEKSNHERDQAFKDMMLDLTKATP